MKILRGARPRTAATGAALHAPSCADHGATNCAMACWPSAVHAATSAHRAAAGRMRRCASSCQSWRTIVRRNSTIAPTCARGQRPLAGHHARPARMVPPGCATRQRPMKRQPCAASAHVYARGPRPEAGFLRQPALEGLTRSARTDSPRRIGRNEFRRLEAAAAALDGGGGGFVREEGRLLST
ncbi:hypothetical protein F511_16286 [Dorcoceras hygrometricum]|uniref:Uncharacterized protein n=1 Tax=Dorcoceras hygrometricum TaxID=472368 RepID=A0A2Z7BAN7_9LAMI|nr:hypothetical protein F511_16286 [Dorcoceras hygrometricum]